MSRQQQQHLHRPVWISLLGIILACTFGLLWMVLRPATVTRLSWNDIDTVPTSIARQGRPGSSLSSSSQRTALPLFLVQSHTRGNHHHADQKRIVLSFTTVPHELSKLVDMVQTMLSDPGYNVFDAIHINIPWTAMRFPKQHYPHTQDVLNQFHNDPRIIVNRLMDHGPMTRYFGALGYEQHPETMIIVYDIDTDQGQLYTLLNLIRASNELDPNSVWCNYGEDFTFLHGTFEPFWFTYDAHLTKDETLAWNPVYFCRGSRGLLIKPKFFQHFSLNATDYHHSCFWDDDRFISFQMALLGIARHNIHPAAWYQDEYVPHRMKVMQACQERKQQQQKKKKKQTSKQERRRRRLGSLSHINMANQPDIHCTRAYITAHPHLFPLATNVTFHCQEDD